MIQKLKELVKSQPVIYYFIMYKIYIKRSKLFDRMSNAEKQKYLDNIYFKIFMRHINWKKPLKYTEKIQYNKLYCNDNERNARMTDKYLVRDWVEQQIGKEYLIPLVGVYDSFKEIDFDSLPNQFAIKCNHDSGSVTIVKNKNLKEWKKMKYKYNYHMKTDFSKFGIEQHYASIKPKIIIEKLMADETGELKDYKFLCFSSKPYYCWVDSDRFGDHKRNTYNMNWELQPWTQRNWAKDLNLVKPNNFDEMIEIVTKLSANIQAVRVDLYNINGKIYFGEMTFSNGSGFEYLEPNIDDMLGKLWRD